MTNEPSQRDEQAILGSPTKQECVQKYIGEGLTYRQIMKEMKFKSVNTVAYYAKNIHQHRLRKYARKSLEIETGMECQSCGEQFFTRGELDTLLAQTATAARIDELKNLPIQEHQRHATQVNTCVDKRMINARIAKLRSPEANHD